MSTDPHMSANYEDDDGWLIARCSCGWEFGAVPDSETACDVLMDHAAEAAFMFAAASVGSESQTPLPQKGPQ